MELLLTLLRKVLTESICNVLLREEDANALEVSIVWSHTIVLQTWDSFHILDVLLSENLCKLLSAVVTEVDEDNNITLLYITVYISVADSLDELVSYALVIALLHSFNHVGSLLTCARNEKIVSLLNTLPTLVTVHCIETTDDACDSSVVSLTNL